MKWTAIFNGDSIDQRAQAVWPWPLKNTHTETKITKKQLHALFNISKDIKGNIIQNPQIRTSKGAFPLSKFLTNPTVIPEPRSHQNPKFSFHFQNHEAVFFPFSQH